MRRRLYLAAPLFSQAERLFNEGVAAALHEQFDVFLPQRDGGLLLEIVATGASVADAREAVFAKDLAAIRACDIFLAVLDGRAVDEGVAFELGFALATGKRCIGLHTDVRRMLPTGNNPMIDAAVERVFTDVGSLLEWVGQFR